ncbi:MAG: 16S rRNA (cytosine(967)-C(5))-methyltransferase RsmB [Candidatus Gastranaerophilales bacterium]|nr:16S rRNA (cytosine(967)-C(5))-methyltransferase RsmB [Candidatus Gastranaerophilales bacterium]
MREASFGPREIVLDILLTLEREDVFSNRLIASVLDKYDYLDGRDKAFIKRVAEGTIERQIELDYDLDQISSTPVRKMKPLIRCLLRMSAYQLLYLDAVPDSAVCNEACKLAQKRGFQNLKGFVNAVLRNLAKQKGALALPDESDGGIRRLSVQYSVPEWLVRMWMEEYGIEIAETLLEGALKVHPVTIRFRADLAESERSRFLHEMEEMGVIANRSVYLGNLYTLENVEGVRSLPGFAQGIFTVQDVSSALAVEAAGIHRGDFVMDVCAAPGGKSMFAAEKAERVLARDLTEGKLAILEENLRRMRISNVITERYDATQTDENYLGQADVVLLDVPCSGLGVMSRKRDIKYRATPESLSEIVKLQRQIVAHSWQYVKPGGILLYSTCTIHRAENEQMVEWILEQFPFEPADPDDLPENLKAQRDLVRQKQAVCGKASSQNTGIQMLPGYMDADGFFFARLRRKA